MGHMEVKSDQRIRSTPIWCAAGGSCLTDDIQAGVLASRAVWGRHGMLAWEMAGRSLHFHRGHPLSFSPLLTLVCPNSTPPFHTHSICLTCLHIDVNIAFTVLGK